MFFAAVPMGLALVGIWSPPEWLDEFQLSSGWPWDCSSTRRVQTAYFVPHGSLGVELTFDYHERTRLYGLSHMIGIFGVAAGLYSLELMYDAEDKRQFAFFLSFLPASRLARSSLLRPITYPKGRNLKVGPPKALTARFLTF